MRIISGEYGGRHLKGLSGDNTRPTTDKVKESIFNMIGPYFDGGVVFDLFAGSGGLAIEAISRGMTKAYLFEKDRHAQHVIAQNIAITKEPEKFIVIKGDSQKLISRVNDVADLVFFDPPYKQQRIVEDITRLVELQLVNSNTVIVCETDKQVALPDTIAPFEKVRHVVYGTIAIHIYEGEEA